MSARWSRPGREQSCFIPCSKNKSAGVAPEFRVDPKTYLDHIAEAKRRVSIPIIASLNCTTLGAWLNYARRITEAGADALELNIYKIPTHTQIPGSTIEEEYIDIVHSVASWYRNPARSEVKSILQQFCQYC